MAAFPVGHEGKVQRTSRAVDDDRIAVGTHRIVEEMPVAVAQVYETHVLSSSRFYKVFEKRHEGSMVNRETMLRGNDPDVQRNSFSKMVV